MLNLSLPLGQILKTVCQTCNESYFPNITTFGKFASTLVRNSISHKLSNVPCPVRAMFRSCSACWDWKCPCKYHAWNCQDHYSRQHINLCIFTVVFWSLILPYSTGMFEAAWLLTHLHARNLMNLPHIQYSSEPHTLQGNYLNRGYISLSLPTYLTTSCFPAVDKHTHLHLCLAISNSVNPSAHRFLEF